MRAAATTMFLALAVIAAASQAPQIQNATTKTQVATSLSRDVATLASRATDPMWVAWQVPMIEGERNLCCTYISTMDAPDGIRGCRVEPTDPDVARTPPSFPAESGPVRLEAGTQLTLFVRLVSHRIERLRALSDDCPVDAGGRPVQWLTGVSGEDSVAWLTATATDESMEADVATKVAAAAVRALALHRTPTAVTALLALAEAAPSSKLAIASRREAVNGLGQSRDPRALQFLERIITR